MPAHFPVPSKREASPEERAETKRRSLALLSHSLRPHRVALIVSILSVFVVTIASAVQPLLIARVLDSAIAPLRQGDSGPLTVLVVLFAVTVAVGALCSWLNVACTVRVSLGVVVYLRKRVFAHAQSLSVSFHEKYTSGKVISRLTNDIDTVRSFLDSGISQLAITLLSMVISAAAIFALDWRIGLLMMFMGVPIYYLTRWFQSRATPVYRRMRTESARLTSRFVETFAGIRAVKAFGAEAKLRSEYAQTAESYRVRVMDSVKVFGIYSPVLILLGDVFIAAALVLGGYAVLGGDMQVGTLLALVIYARRGCLPSSRRSPRLPIPRIPFLPFSRRPVLRFLRLKTRHAAPWWSWIMRSSATRVNATPCRRRACASNRVRRWLWWVRQVPASRRLPSSWRDSTTCPRVLCASTAWMCAT